MSARTLMIQGTSSSAGKSLLVAAFCRIFARRGMRVAPFKAQNMSNNAAVCADGAEIGRSQALQAAAARIAPTADMNPILLKPEADSRSQVIVQGRPWQTLEARRYYRSRHELWPVVTASLNRLRSEFELVVIEGAGSPAELNLKSVDLVNMAVARYAQSPVLLVGDIERGGVFAQLLGTLWLLPEEERRLVRGLIVNKFRGDLSLFDSGRRQLEERGEVPVLGVIPWIRDLRLPEEDGQPLNANLQKPPDAGGIDVAVIRLPHIANFDDFDPLAAEPGVVLRYVDAVRNLGKPHAVILPGTKATMADLAWLRESGLAAAVSRLATANQAAVVGICGGYQMLGKIIRDPVYVESLSTESAGLGLLPVETVFEATKETHQVHAIIEHDAPFPGCRGTLLSGYEIHMGRSLLAAGKDNWLCVTERSGRKVTVPDGAFSPDGRIWGCYIHGLFANASLRKAWLAALRRNVPDSESRGYMVNGDETQSMATDFDLEAALDRLADHVEAALDIRKIEKLLQAEEEREPCLTK